MGKYALSNEGLERMRLGEQLLDPATKRAVGLLIEPGMRVLELGVGAGSIFEWLGEMVGSTGYVEGWDINTSLVSSKPSPHMRLIEADIEREVLPSESFDVIHARNVLVHLECRVEVVSRMLTGLRPGGCMVLEEPDLSTAHAEPAMSSTVQKQLFESVLMEIHAMMQEVGVELEAGSYLRGELARFGCSSVHADYCSYSIHGGGEQARYFALTYRRLCSAVTASGRIAMSEYDGFLALLDDPSFRWLAPTMWTIVARR